MSAAALTTSNMASSSRGTPSPVGFFGLQTSSSKNMLYPLGRQTQHFCVRIPPGLPHELLLHVMERLSFSDLKACRLVCRSFAKSASERIHACIVKHPVAKKYMPVVNRCCILGYSSEESVPTRMLPWHGRIAAWWMRPVRIESSGRFFYLGKGTHWLGTAAPMFTRSSESAQRLTRPQPRRSAI